jgi:hypothetical protein
VSVLLIVLKFMTKRWKFHPIHIRISDVVIARSSAFFSSVFRNPAFVPFQSSLSPP